jgi:hypothetical protein
MKAQQVTLVQLKSDLIRGVTFGEKDFKKGDATVCMRIILDNLFNFYD